ncbi:carboxylesterase family protein [Paenibacillus spongiae]|uniref:Prolyl oligopeptidase family serine peptidase n=1 Tax=Paenibacillus spongiae TaxID=2909671 RepID=A0ABY5SFE0_9BACL|nr:PHB depolymerase family esterase [Paenibacillus spongiae]UVI32687.1 prolyl oligopeptidase family serine peptidase [Paenibacillus spongiae]
MTQLAQKFEATIAVQVKLDYLLHLPKSYDSAQDKKWPVIVFLHGAGERGSDLELVKIHGIPKIVEQQEDFPFIAVSPQCPLTSYWPVEKQALKALIDDIIQTHQADPDRIYLTGLSMGGYGTWEMASNYPQLFAAVAPICGGGDPGSAHFMKDVPAWVFHGDADSVISVTESEKMVEALKSAGGNVRFTVYPGVDHNSWSETYDNPELYEWFLSHSK